MIINNWYAAAFADELNDAPLAVRMLGCDFVLFRDAGGVAACLSAVCCHRGGALGRGRRVDGCVQCPYHGWEYAKDGRVQRIPALGDDAKIPARARVDSYPVMERWGLVWAFLGDLAEHERPVLPDLLPEFGDETHWRMCRLEREWQVDWLRLTENLADASHLHMVHSFGRHLPMETEVFPVIETDWGIRIPQTYAAAPNEQSRTAANTTQAREQRTESTVTVELSVIGLMQRNAMQMVSGYDQVIWNACTPVDAFTTRHFNLHFRNFRMEPDFDATMLETNRQGFEEDAIVIEHLQPTIAAAGSSAELLVATDGPERAWRNKARQLGGQLGIIDVREMQALSLDRVLVIPGPDRAGGGPWIHETVPLAT